MKKLEELGISPWPWRADADKCGNENDVLCDYTSDLVRKGERRTKVVARCNAHFETFKADIHVIAAAPKLYKALYELVEAYEACNAHDGTCENCERRKMCQQDEERIIANAKSTLAEAAGERGEDK